MWNEVEVFFVALELVSQLNRRRCKKVSVNADSRTLAIANPLKGEPAIPAKALQVLGILKFRARVNLTEPRHCIFQAVAAHRGRSFCRRRPCIAAHSLAACRCWQGHGAGYLAGIMRMQEEADRLTPKLRSSLAQVPPKRLRILRWSELFNLDGLKNAEAQMLD